MRLGSRWARCGAVCGIHGRGGRHGQQGGPGGGGVTVENILGIMFAGSLTGLIRVTDSSVIGNEPVKVNRRLNSCV